MHQPHYVVYIPEVFEAVRKTDVKSSLLEIDSCLAPRLVDLLELRTVVSLVLAIIEFSVFLFCPVIKPYKLTTQI